MKQQEIPAIEYRHTLPVQLRFNDIDAFGHVNNSVYIQLMDQAKYAYFSDLMHDNLLGDEEYDLVVVNINVSFMAPTYISDSIEVLTAVTHVGNRSVTLNQEIRQQDTGEVKCIATTVMARISPNPIPDTWRELFK